MYPERSMVEQSKYSLIAVQINWEPGVEMTQLKIFFPSVGLQQENLSMRVKESCHHQFLFWCNRGHSCVNDVRLLYWHT